MNSMVAAYHKTKSSVSNEKDLERQHSKKKAKSFPDQSEPSSPIEEKTVFEDSKISVAVENDTNKVQENAVDIDLEHAEKETEDDSKHDLSDEDSLAVTENQHVVEKSDMDFGPDTTSNGLVVSESGTENAESEQKETKQLFFISPSSVEVAGIISDEKSPIEPPAASSSKQPLLMMRNSSSNAKEKDVMIPAPFAEYVDMNRLHEALSAERVHLYLGHEHVTEEGLKLALKKKDDKSLKPLIRQNHWGADNKIRALLWQLLCKHLHKAHEDDTYDEFAKDMFTPGTVYIILLIYTARFLYV